MCCNESCGVGQVAEARAEVCTLRVEMSSLKSRYEQKARQAELSEEAMELLTDELHAALASLRSREERNLHHQDETEKLRVQMDSQQKRVSFLQAFS